MHDEPIEELRRHIDEHMRELSPAFGSVWVADHFHPGVPWLTPEDDNLEAFATMVYLATKFPNYTVGSIVLGNDYRPPALLARMGATLQALTGGRLILGMGSGWAKAEYDAFGYTFDVPSVRLARLAEAIQLVRRLWTEPSVTFHGEHYTLVDASCNPRPHPTPPILVGAGGRRLALRLVAEHADWWAPQSSTIEEYAELSKVLEEHCSAVGRNYGEIVRVFSISCVAIAETRKKAQALADRNPYVRTRPETAVIGEPDEVAEQLTSIAALGVSHLVIRFADFPALHGAMLFCEQVVPALSS
jgi:alkanesulfonate monooxygenase SsuD/methylene tetrahydromethanopterin reductase-like flavin-dependent oxidoreductase (luciferase family)